MKSAIDFIALSAIVLTLLSLVALRFAAAGMFGIGCLQGAVEKSTLCRRHHFENVTGRPFIG